MSLSTDFHAVKRKSADVFGQVTENHPVLTSLITLVSLSVGLILLTQLLLH